MSIHVSFILPENVNVAGFENPRQGFLEANSALEAQGKPRAFEVEIVGVKKQIKTASGCITITADKTLDEIRHTDLIIIPPLQGNLESALMLNAPLYPWICEKYQAGAEVVSLCVGAFLLAQTGILDGKTCVTHWRANDIFRKLFPKVQLLREEIITDEDGIYTGGGAFSSANLMLYLIEKFVDRETALYCSKIFQIDFNRVSQSQFIMFTKQKEHGDQEILSVQQFLENEFSKNISVHELSEKLAMSRRTFERRFKNATANTPIEYLQRIRVEAAKKALENDMKTVNEIMYEVGYNDSKSFREVFRKISGLSPADYRKRFIQKQTTHQIL